MSQKGARSDRSDTGSEIKSGGSGSYSSDPWICGKSSSGEASAVCLENSSKEINPSSSKSDNQSNGYNSSDYERVKHNSRNKVKSEFWDKNSDSYDRRRLGRSRREVDRLSIADSDSRELERIQNRNYKYKRVIRNVESPKSDINFKESHMSKRRRGQTNIPLEEKKLAGRRSYDNKLHDSTEISDDESWRVIRNVESPKRVINFKESHMSKRRRGQTNIPLEEKKLAGRRSYDNKLHDSTEKSDDESWSQKTTRRKRGAIRSKEASDQQTGSSDLSEFEEVLSKGKSKPKQNELKESINSQGGQIGDIKENPPDNTEEESNAVKSETRVIRNVESPESDINFKESHMSKRRRGQTNISLEEKKLARRSYDNKLHDSIEISDDESWSQKTTRRKRGAIRSKEASDQQTGSSDLSEFEEVLSKGKSKPKQNELKESINSQGGQIGDIKENPPDNTEEESNAVKSETRVIRNVESPESDINFKESHMSKRRRGQTNISLEEKKLARRSYDNKLHDSTEISDDESWSQKTTRRKRGAIRSKEASDQQTGSSDLSEFEEVLSKGKSKPKQNELKESINSQGGQIGDIKENPADNTEEESNAVKSETSEPRRRRWWMISQKSVYGLGHVYNDLCAALWFSYMMLFFQAVMEMRAVVAGYMILLGSILIITTFSPIFIRCIGCSTNADPAFLSWWMPLYYAGFIIFFQFGWAAVQISHLAMIPAISESSQVRAELTSIRTTASMASSIMAYLSTWIVLKMTNSYIIGPDDDYKFRNVALIITAIGITTTVLFHIFFKLKMTVKSDKDSVEDDNDTSIKTEISYFLKMPLMYYTSLLYVFSRLFWTLSLVYIPLFLEERLAVNPVRGSELVASVPLVVYISSFILSMMLKKFIGFFGNQGSYLIGSVISVISCIWIALAIHPRASIAHIYLVAILIGAGSAITQVASLSITADFIGINAQRGAVVYSIVTFADKLVTGVAVVGVEHFKCGDCSEYYRGVLSNVCGGSALLGILVLGVQTIGKRPPPDKGKRLTVMRCPRPVFTGDFD